MLYQKKMSKRKVLQKILAPRRKLSKREKFQKIFASRGKPITNQFFLKENVKGREGTTKIFYDNSLCGWQKFLSTFPKESTKFTKH